MAITKTYKCDQCGGEKREANHWWAVHASTRHLVVDPLEEAERAGLGSDDLVLCGQECVTRKLAQWMNARAR